MTTEKQNGTIGNILKQLRENKKLSMANVATALGVSLSAYQKYENNTRDVSTTLLNKLADFYGVTTDYLLGREPAADPLKNMDIHIDSVDSDSFINAYEKLPECVKQIFIDTMLKLSQAAAERDIERFNDLSDGWTDEQLHAELDRQLKTEETATEKSEVS